VNPSRGKQVTESNISYVVGEEKRLTDILGETEVLQLLRWAVKSGAQEARICNADGEGLWSARGDGAEGRFTVNLPIQLEGEPVGKLTVVGKEGNEESLAGLAGLLLIAFDTIIVNSLKRMLTTEIHSHLVNLSYEELLESNRQLAESEGRYRQLAEELEKKVEERTRELKSAHVRLLQQEKMASIAQLAAGMAHEINNPLGFIISNLHTLGKYTSRFTAMLAFFRTILKGGGEYGMEEAARLSGEKWRELKLDNICSDLGELLTQSLEGAERVKKLVADLKGFSHIDDGEMSIVNINSEIDRTLGVLAHAVPPGTEITRNYEPLPGFLCNPALLCQAFLNIILNALQCRAEGLRLVIATTCDESEICVSMVDNGPGIPEDIRNRIFEPFFTTKEVGSGTGMGLAVVYDVITAYGGNVEVESSQGKGARFIVRLPSERKKV
jgi:two-component system NtrC family sensor kinase